ncbi:serine/threonine protein kinase [Streptomyces flavotricini]|uniref:non-specific serine/threonine protein kinase n=1 Tax=Streptomyces flavotricini TaxID=66888 RepID=A0ABS8E7D1_9ACTN|nr:serine/threonine-protein kinase [Streptomyces flavotricini]MCC0096457.1 serine/threonine protein kinase [Streptomyces flavotricini]
MSKPEHTESPAESPAAKQEAARAAKPAAAPVAESAVPSAVKPGTAKPAAVPAAESDAAKPEPGADAAAIEDAEPATGVAEGGEPAPGAAGDGAPQDAKPAGPPAAKADLSKSAAAGAGRAAAPQEAEPAAPAAAKPDLGKPAEPAEEKKAPASNPVVEKADAVAAAVKAAAAKAAEGGQDEGRLLARRYRLREVLGKGGMGTVWRAEDETLGRTVAVKELRFSTGVDEDEKRRLITRTLREAKAIARIRSGGAVTVFDVVDEDGRPWIVMELIEGPSLAEFIRENGPLTPHRAAEVGLAVLDVLRAAHGQGILHRDVKPSNVLIARTGRVVLTDFGIAQVEGDPSVTSTGMLVGAPSYISPERARGQKPGPPADMWSLGGLLYAAVEGVPPYDKGSALATLTAVMTEPVEPPKNAGPLTEVIYGLLAKDPARRLDDDRARAMLTAVVNAPEPVAAPVLAPAVEETRQISLADAKEAAAKAAAEKAAERAAEKAEKKERERLEREQRERARAALKATRKAAAAAAATTAASAAESPASTPVSGRPSPVPAPLTDVMSRRTIALAITGVVVALAVIGSLIAYAFSGDDAADKKKEEGKGGPGTTVSGSPNPTPSAKTGGTNATSGKGGTGSAGGEPSQGQSPGGQQGQGQGQGQTQGQGQSQGQGSAPGGPAAGLPDGYAKVTDPGFHFSMVMPSGFKVTGIAGENSGAIYSRDGGFPRIQVDYTASPGNDARAAWAEAVAGTASSSTNYRTIRIDTTEYNGYPTVADWEFEREQKGMKVRVLNRGFKVDAKHGYAIMISCPADQWDAPECTTMRNTAFQTFQPLG